jgi:hypothetical protein
VSRLPKWKLWQKGLPFVFEGHVYVEHGVVVVELERMGATGEPVRYLAAAYAPGSWTALSRVDPPTEEG